MRILHKQFWEVFQREMSSWHTVESWSTQQGDPAYSQRGVFPASPCGKDVFTDFTCPCWKCRYIKSRPPFECSDNPIRRRYKEEMERKAATHIQKIWRRYHQVFLTLPSSWCPKSKKGSRLEDKYLGFTVPSVRRKKAAKKIQKIFRGFLVRNPTGIPTKEFTEKRWLSEWQV